MTLAGVCVLRSTPQRRQVTLADRCVLRSTPQARACWEPVKDSAPPRRNAPGGMRIQRFNQQSYLGPSKSGGENYLAPHPAPEMVSLLKQDGIWHQQAGKEQRPDIEASRKRSCRTHPPPSRRLLLTSFCRAQPQSTGSLGTNRHP